MPRYRYQPFPCAKPPEAGSAKHAETPVLVVGAGPVGLAAAIDLAIHGIKSIIVDDNNVVSTGSRAICWAKRTLEIFDRLGVADRMVEKGVTWKVGRLFHRDKEVYSFDLLPETGHKMPAFINLQQYYVEQYLVERCLDFPELIDLRWRNKAVALARSKDRATVTVETPNGLYQIDAKYVLACDGAKSTIRRMMSLDFEGKAFEERFLICDIEMHADFPSERWFWFEPPFHKGESALLHKQPDNIYRIDLQLGPEADPEEEKKPERVIPRIKAIVGEKPFEIDWTSVYTFHCRRLSRFVHDRVIFAGDSAHVVSPFGARGGNGGIQDVDNLCWKLASVVKGEAPARLLESYNIERIHGADENILNSSRTTTFMTPKSDFEKSLRAAVLSLAAEHPFARTMVNSGRLSAPCSYEACGAVGQDEPFLPALTKPGRPAADAPLGNGYLLGKLGNRYQLFAVNAKAPAIAGIERLEFSGKDITTELRARYLGDAESAVYLVRPDQHIAARWRQCRAPGIREALATSSANQRP
jgi:3-(3-hydroxy-phenyl)propionate hydroxylase